MLTVRFIPAHAGNTRGSAAPVRGHPVHPRACGEHLPAGLGVLCGHGSSPRMRGTPHLPTTVTCIQRFIPAHAGNTVENEEVTCLMTVHPRACGEHQVPLELTRLILGSSPRMRGTHYCHPL